MTEQQISKLLGSLVEHQARFASLPTEDAQWAIQNTTSAVDLCVEAIKNRVKTVSSKINSLLKLLTSNESLVLDATDGTETLAEAKDIFAWIDSDLKSWGTNKKGPATKKTPVQVYEMTQDGTFAQMFGSLSSDLRKLCLTQSQIKGFVKNHRDWLRTDGYATLFLFESSGHFFVANVYVVSDGLLEVSVSRLENSLVWNAEYRRRMAVPQLA